MKKIVYISISFLLAVVLFSFSFIEKVNGQTVNVKLSPAPQGKLGIADLWNVSLTNTSNETYEIYLYGTLTEKSEGLIATATTSSFDLKKGTRKIKASDFPATPDVTYPGGNPKYKKALVMTGSLPPGEYEYCVYARLKKNSEDMGSDCLEQIIEDPVMISLISSNDGEEIDTKTLIIFTWVSAKLQKDDNYNLRVVDIQEGQSSEVAIQRNNVWFEQLNIQGNTFKYPKIAKQFEEGKKYAWRIKSGKTESEFRNFKIKQNKENDSLIVGSCDLFEDNYDNPTLWTIVKTNYSGGSCPSHNASGDIKILGSQCQFVNAEDNCDIRVWRNLGITLPDTWQADFDYVD